MDYSPTFIHRNGTITDPTYIKWLSEIKNRFHQSQLKAAIRVNSAMLEFYWSLGRDIVAMKAESHWGSGFFNQLSLDLKDMFPNQTGFSATNLKYMMRWYRFYNERVIIRQRPIDEFKTTSDLPSTNDLFGQRAIDQLEMPQLFGQIPWGQHIDIISRCATLEEALFYLNMTIENAWSRPALERQMSANLFEAHGKAITNFVRTLPSPQGQIVQEILKSPYNLEFLTMRQGYEEKELEDALVKNVTQFLLELGNGFAYVGRQKELRIDEESVFFPDLIFYHIPQKRYVIIELKAVKFAPEFAGKLNFYVTAADKLLRGEGDNPSVGLLICKTAKKTIVEWSLQDINKPLGVATYQLEEVVDRTVIELEQKKQENKRQTDKLDSISMSQDTDASSDMCE